MPKISAQKREARQQQILDAATRCFAREGFHRTSMEDIVREAKLSPGAIYCYFRGKNEIVAAIANQRHQRESALLAQLLSVENVQEGLRELIRDFSALLQDPQESQRRKLTVQVWAESLRDRDIRKIVERGLRQRDALTSWLRKAQEKGQLRAAVDPDALSRIMLAILQGFVLQRAWEPDLDSAEWLRAASELLEAAIAAPGNNNLSLSR